MKNIKISLHRKVEEKTIPMGWESSCEDEREQKLGQTFSTSQSPPEENKIYNMPKDSVETPHENIESREENFSLSLQHASSQDNFNRPFLEEDEKELMEKIRSILYQENISDDELILQLLNFFENHKSAIHSQILRNTFALIMSLYGIHELDDLKRCMQAAYGEGPSVRLQKKIFQTREQILQVQQQKILPDRRTIKIDETLKELVSYAVETAPFLNEESDLSLRYKIVTGFIGKILGHMGQFKVDLVMGLIRLLFTELDDKTNQVFSADIWFYANGTFKKKSM